MLSANISEEVLTLKRQGLSEEERLREHEEVRYFATCRPILDIFRLMLLNRDVRKSARKDKKEFFNDLATEAENEAGQRNMRRLYK